MGNMKLINSLQGAAAIQVSADDVLPVRGLVINDLIRFIGDTYQFIVRPQITSEIALAQHFTFQAGEFSKGDDKFAIAQLSILPNGDVITATSTDIAQMIMDDYIERLDNVLNFRFGSAKMQRFYLSSLVVEFEAPGIAENIESMAKIESILNREIHRPEMPFKIKRLAFGYGDVNAQQILSIDSIEKSDLVLERRSGEPYSNNRFYSSAPVSTSEHVRILNLIEQALAG
jgi:hypothetical protein